MSQLFSTPIKLQQLDPPVRERVAIPLASNSGGVQGDDGAIIFPTGAEVYTFDSDSIRGPLKPKAVTSAWIDASALAAGKTLTIQFSNGQKFILQNTTAAAGQGPQGYFITPLPAPFKVTISTNNAAALTVFITFYNYNVAFTGFQLGSQLPASAAGAGGGASGGSSSGGGSTGGSGGGGFRGCPKLGTQLAPINVNPHSEIVTEIFDNEKWIEIICENKFELTATPDHPVYTMERGKQTLLDLEVGEHVLTAAGEQEVVSKKLYKEAGQALKVTVSDTHLFYANGILSHNKA